MPSKKKTEYEKKRKEERIDLIGDISFSSSSNPPTLPDDGILINISNTGAGFYTYHAIEVGSILEIQGEGVWNGIRQATVRWCNKIDEGIYRIGLSFFDN